MKSRERIAGLPVKSATKDECGIARLRRALEESVELQSHYAKLLNMYDGGKRTQFDSADAWIKRLADLRIL